MTSGGMDDEDAGIQCREMDIRRGRMTSGRMDDGGCSKKEQAKRKKEQGKRKKEQVNENRRREGEKEKRANRG